MVPDIEPPAPSSATKAIRSILDRWGLTVDDLTTIVDAKRSQLSPVYAAHVESWLQEFAKTFPGHHLGDLNRDFLAKYMASFADLSSKSRNDRRAAVTMFLRWCARQDYLPQTHRLFEADAMQKEQLDTAATDFTGPPNCPRCWKPQKARCRLSLPCKGWLDCVLRKP